MMIARGFRFAPVVSQSKIRAEIKRKGIANPDCGRGSTRRRQLSGDRANGMGGGKIQEGLSQRQGKVTALLPDPRLRKDAFVKAYPI
jgi:hypothetical protein